VTINPLRSLRGFLAEFDEPGRRREQARRAREFSRADALRAELAQRGFTVEDGPAGPVLTRTRSVAV
jgi:cysteinyl-tRNA synthetase